MLCGVPLPVQTTTVAGALVQNARAAKSLRAFSHLLCSELCSVACLANFESSLSSRHGNFGKVPSYILKRKQEALSQQAETAERWLQPNRIFVSQSFSSLNTSWSHQESPAWSHIGLTKDSPAFTHLGLTKSLQSTSCILCESKWCVCMLWNLKECENLILGKVFSRKNTMHQCLEREHHCEVGLKEFKIYVKKLKTKTPRTTVMSLNQALIHYELTFQMCCVLKCRSMIPQCFSSSVLSNRVWFLSEVFVFLMSLMFQTCCVLKCSSWFKSEFCLDRLLVVSWHFWMSCVLKCGSIFQVWFLSEAFIFDELMLWMCFLLRCGSIILVWFLSGSFMFDELVFQTCCVLKCGSMIQEWFLSGSFICDELIFWMCRVLKCGSIIQVWFLSGAFIFDGLIFPRRCLLKCGSILQLSVWNMWFLPSATAELSSMWSIFSFPNLSILMKWYWEMWSIWKLKRKCLFVSASRPFVMKSNWEIRWALKLIARNCAWSSLDYFDSDSIWCDA